ncbi:MAG: multicopper oxidase domain-containing protein [Chloroflexota bacterium]
MTKQKFLNMVLSILMIASLLFGASGSVEAQGRAPGSGGGKVEIKQNREAAIITQAERQAAADRAAEKGFALPKLGQAQMVGRMNTNRTGQKAGGTPWQILAPIGGTVVPHYYGPYPNYANSPLRLPDALVEFLGDGTGAAASAVVDPATGAVTDILLESGGSGFTTAPTVSISSAVMGGTGATATATISGSVATVQVTNGGSGYTAPVTVEFTGGGGAGATGVATVSPTGFVTGITVTNGGSGYTEAGTTVEITGDGIGAAATVVVSSSGSIAGINITNGGSGYTTATVDIIGDGTGATAAATVTPTGFVSAVNLLNGGSGYTELATSVDITGDGTGATATVVVSPIGFVTGITVTNGGSGYTDAATIIEISGDGLGATAVATIDPGTGSITGITVTNGGSGYTTATVNITGDGAGATADALLDTTSGPITAINLTNGGSGYTVAPTVTILGDGAGAAADAAVDTTSGSITAITMTNGGSGYTSASVNITGDGAGATADAVLGASGPITAINVTNGGSGYTTAAINLLGDGAGATADAILDTTTGSIASVTITNGGSGYTSAPAVSFLGGDGLASATATISGSVTSVTLVSGGSGYVTTGIRKFVDGLPGLGPTGANNLGQYIPVAVADQTTYPGSDYFEIALVEYEEQMHSDLPPTKLRGYVQLSTAVVPGAQIPLFNPDGSPILLPDGSQAVAVDSPHYLGPLIAATKDKPVRILFRNLLPTGLGGNLFIPVDTTVMGAGPGPNMTGAEPDPQNPACNDIPKPYDCFTENRATLHLHGGINPWISDGTPHQWVTPANETTPYPVGVSVKNVPDMPDPGPGAMTFFYTNQQSARLMFYHDHAWGITRLNVYAGEAAAYLITDPKEQELVTNGIIPADQIPLVVQDKTFVPQEAELALEDPTWDLARWGDFGDLWVPHVYVPAQNPGDSSGVNQFGRWAYGPWFWPPTTNVSYGPIANPYYDPNCDPDLQWCEPPLTPGTPNISMGMEAFNDTPTVNGTAYPTITVDPKSYRLRFLNAANDRFFNLSLYKAVDANGVLCDAANLAPAPEATGVTCTEVMLNPTEVADALLDTTIHPTPVVGTEGPDWIQIGTEGGFLPTPVVIPAQPITWVNDPTVFNAGNVDQHSLLLGPAERADVIVDFSAYAGQTIILYNDAPAAFPARDPRYDYYTGNADLRDTGGAPSTPAGYGPNTRTVMQIKVANVAPAPAFDLAALQNAFAHQPDGSGVFESSQHPIIVGQAPYNAAYGTTFKTNGPRAGLVQIFDTTFSFDTLAGVPLTFDLRPKQIQDEMGEAFDPEYGRMSGFLGLEAPNASAINQNMILYPFVNPSSENFDGIELPPGVEVTPIATANDGTQIWKITHNGVDTHPIHFHLYDVQLINRVGWDGIIRRPDANELGWKDTVRISPLEDTIVAMRPIIPKLPFGLPDSFRPLNPREPLGSTVGFNPTDANGDPIPGGIVNQVVNFGWEYVWHCHILSHEEMDMMRPTVVTVDRQLPQAPILSVTGLAGNPINLSWTDGTPVDYASLAAWGDPANEIGYRVERAVGAGAYSTIANVFPNITSYQDSSAVLGQDYSYRVVAYNAAGDSVSNAEFLDGTPPAVVSINRVNANPTSAGAVVFAVTFSEPVLNVGGLDFGLTTTGVTGASIFGVSGGGDTRSVTVLTGTGDGTIRLDVPGGATINDAAGNALAGPYTAGQVYDVDKTAPTVVSITRANPNPTNAGAVVFNVTFSEPVLNVGGLDFSLTTTGVTGASIFGLSGSGNTRSVTVLTGTGDGTIRLDVPGSATINDVVGNALTDPYTAGQVYDVVKTAPTVVSINRVNPNPTSAGAVVFNVTFSVPVFNAGAADFGLTTTGVTGASIFGVSGSGSTRSVTVLTGAGDGTIRLDVLGSATINDAAGTALAGPYTAGQVYDVDKTAPTVVSINRANANPTSAGVVVFNVTFSEPVLNAGAADFSLTTTGVTGASIFGVSGSGSTRSVTVLTGAGDGTIRLDVPGSATINDATGNALAGPYTAGQVYDVDKTAPTVVSITRANPNPTNAGAVVYTVIFSEPVLNVGGLDFGLTTTGVTGASIFGVSGGGTTWSVTVLTGTGSGTIRLDVLGSAIINDAAGSVVTGIPFTAGEVYDIVKP